MNEEPQKFLAEIQNVSGDAMPPEAMLIKKTSAVKEAPQVARTGGESFSEGEGQLTIDVYQTPEEIVIESPIAGVNPDDLDVAITDESVTIRGKREREQKVREGDYFYQECYWGRFSRSVILPHEIDPEKAEASIKNGVLLVRLPKVSRSKTRKIKVRLD